METASLFDNWILISAGIGWLLAQLIKVPLNFIFHREWNWSLLLSTGGMPSSHSALVAGAAQVIGSNALLAHRHGVRQPSSQEVGRRIQGLLVAAQRVVEQHRQAHVLALRRCVRLLPQKEAKILIQLCQG